MRTRHSWQTYYQEYKKELASKNRLWRLTNAVHIKTYAKEYRRTHPEKKRESENKRRARIANVLVEDVRLSVLLERDGKFCYLCLKDTEKPTIDHIVPLSLGGEHSYRNTKIACSACNSRKKDRLVAAGAYANG